ncbi:hypothetical protein TWF173_001286 [Orbilia oligospora]|nr:hypothetical protein TWF173_001286 [Orbilia oligospora]
MPTLELELEDGGSPEVDTERQAYRCMKGAETRVPHRTPLQGLVNHLIPRKLREMEPWITMNRDGRQDEGAEGLWASEMRKIANQQENLKRDESAPSH